MTRKQGDTEETAPKPELREKASIPKAAPKRKDISIIERVGQSVVVQWMEEDDYHKSTVPATEVREGQALLGALLAGEESFTWEKAGLDAIWAKALRQARIFDPQDYGRDPYVAQKAIVRLSSQTIAKIIKEYR